MVTLFFIIGYWLLVVGCWFPDEVNIKSDLHSNQTPSHTITNCMTTNFYSNSQDEKTLSITNSLFFTLL